MWFGVAPVTPPHVKRRAERLQQELHAAHCACPAHGSASPRPRAPPSPRRVAADVGGARSAARRQGGRSDDLEDAKGPRRRLRAGMTSPRYSSRTPLASLASGGGGAEVHSHTQIEQLDALRGEEGDAPERQGAGLLRRRGETCGDNEKHLRSGSQSENQRHRDDSVGDASEWKTKAHEERGPDDVTQRMSTRESTPQTLRPLSSSLRFNLGRRASRRLSRSGEDCAPSSANTCTTLESESLLPFLCRSNEQHQPSKRAAASTPKLKVTARPETLVGHASSVCALITTDDHILVSCSRDGLVKIWSRISFTCLQTLSGHEDNVSCIDVRGDWLVSGSHDTTLRVYRRKWRRSTYCDDSQFGGSAEFELHGVFRGHTGHVTKVQIPEAMPAYVFSCSDDATLRAWNTECGQCVLMLNGHTSRVTCFTLYHNRVDGESIWPYTVCSGAADASVCIWRFHQMPSGNQQDGDQGRGFDLEVVESCIFRTHKSTVQCVIVLEVKDSSSPSSLTGSAEVPLLVSGSNDGTIQLFNLHTLNHLGKLHNCKSPVYALAATPSGRLVCSTRDGRLLLFDKATWLTATLTQVPVELKVAPTWLSSLQLRGDLVACCGEDVLYVVSILDSTLVLLLAVETKHSFINCVRWVHSRALLTCGQDITVRLWNIA